MRYLTHDNGGRPFTVIIDNNDIKVYSNSFSDETEEYTTENFVLQIHNPYQVFVGKSPLNEMTKFSGGYGPKFTGNSILIRPSEKLNYIFISFEIFSFNTSSEILYFMAPIGNNDVPYPYAITNKYLLLFVPISRSGKYIYPMISLDKIPTDLVDKFKNGSDDPYTYHYEHDPEKLFKNIKRENFDVKIMVNKIYNKSTPQYPIFIGLDKNYNYTTKLLQSYRQKMKEKMKLRKKSSKSRSRSKR